MKCQCETCDCEADTSGSHMTFCCEDCARAGALDDTAACPCDHAGCGGEKRDNPAFLPGRSF